MTSISITNPEGRLRLKAAALAARRLGSFGLSLPRREPFPLLILASTLVLLVRHLSAAVSLDSWLLLLSGRVVTHGLPHREFLTIWPHGAEWVDQQWLSQLIFYGLFVLGGVKLALVTHIALTVASVAAAMAAARSTGASSIRTAMVAGAAVPIMALAWQLRAQSIAGLLFVGLLWLLIEDNRAPSRRVLLVLPLLALWANLHGSVLLAAGLVTMHGAFSVARRRATVPLARSAALLLAPGLCIFASPYGFALAGYYRTFLFNPGLRKYVDEWHATTLSLNTAPFYVGVLLAFWLLGRSRSLTWFDRVAIILTAAGGLATGRNIIWFGLTACVVLPRALDEAWPASRVERSRVSFALGLAATGAFVVAVGILLASPLRWLDTRYPPAAATAVSRATATDPSLRVYADVRWADWLLFREPSLYGRLAMDTRVDLLSLARLRDSDTFANNIGDDWKRVVSGYRLLVLGRDSGTEGSFLAEPGTRTLYRDGYISVLLRASQPQ